MIAGLRDTLVLALLALFASLMLYSGLDRSALNHPSLDAPAFIPMGPQRLRNAAVVALDAEKLNVAARFARAAVVRDPINPASLSLLGATQLRSGDFQGAQRSYLAAGFFGWRDPATQAYIIAQAEAGRDTRVMAERTDALLRTGQPYALMASTLRKIEQMPGGPAALATRLSLTPDWSDAYITQANLESDTGLERRLAILKDARIAGFVVDCEKVDDAATALLAADRPKIAYAYWTQLGCGDGGPFNLNARAGSFAEISNVPIERPTSFGWSFGYSALVQARIDVSSGSSASRAVYISGGGPTTVIAIRRALLLPPGRYRLKWRARNIPGEPLLGMSVEIICYNNGLPLIQRSGSAEVDGSSFAILVVPNSRCAAQQLRFVAQPTSGMRHGIWIDAVSLEPLGPAA